MKNLIFLALMLTVLSCDKQEVIEINEVQETKSVEIDYSDNAYLAMAGRLCNCSGIKVSVKLDTLYPRYIMNNGQVVETIWHTEFFYYKQYGSTMWCNEKYLHECDCD